MTTVQDSSSFRPSRIWADLLRYAPSSIVPALTAALASAVFTRLLTPSSYGIYGLALAVIGLASTVLGQLIGTSTGRYYIEYLQSGKLDIYRTAVTWLVYAMVASCFILTCLAEGVLAVLFHSEHFFWIVTGSGMLVAVQTITTMLIPILSASFRPTHYSLATSGAAVLSFGLSFLLLWSVGHQAYTLLWGGALGQGLVIPFILRRFPLSPLRTVLKLPTEARTAIFRFIAYGAPMVLWVLSSSLMGLADRSFLQAFDGSAAVGVYGLNSNVSGQTIGLAIGPLNTGSWPILMKQWEDGDRSGVEASLASFTKSYLVISVGIVGLLAVVGQPFEDLLFGPRFTGGFEVLVPCLIGRALWGAGRLGHSILKLAQKTRVLAADALAAGVLNVVLAVIAIPRFGMLGAAYSLIPSFALYIGLVWWQSRKIVPWRVNVRSSTVIVGIAVAGWVAAKLINPSLPPVALLRLMVGAFAFGVVYALGLVSLLKFPFGLTRSSFRKKQIKILPRDIPEQPGTEKILAPELHGRNFQTGVEYTSISHQGGDGH